MIKILLHVWIVTLKGELPYKCNDILDNCYQQKERGDWIDENSEHLMNENKVRSYLFKLLHYGVGRAEGKWAHYRLLLLLLLLLLLFEL